MSVQFGRWNWAGRPAAPDYIEKVSAALAPYGPDSNESYSKGDVRILYRAFHTTKESHRETQPHISSSGAVITWDGRLDNRADFVVESRGSLTIDSADVEIVAGEFSRCGNNCFARLIGDWAVSVWNPTNRTLILAKDPIGTRHLYYSIEKDQVTWSSILDPLLRFAGRGFTLDEEYIAGWLSYFPAAHLTPYAGIYSIPPSSFVSVRPGNHTTVKYWDFDGRKEIRYHTDAGYEEHFRSALAIAVHRRLRSDRPVLAELSGGMDSSSIVCIADTLIARCATEPPRLDTISWYDDSHDHIEPDSNESRYFAKVEEKRGRIGCRINLRSLEKSASPRETFVSEFDNDGFAAIPSAHRKFLAHSRLYAAYMLSAGHRVTLSGIGGDEVTGGGVPTPTPELQNLLASAKFVTLTRQLNAWAVKMRKARLPLLWRALRGFIVPALVGVSAPDSMHPPSWFNPDFIRRNQAALCGYPTRVKLFGPLPSFQENLVTLNVLRRLLASVHDPDILREVRFPYLDRDFLEFLYGIPREQLVRVGQRRALMKRALVNIVPDEILNRKRKAFLPPDAKQKTLPEWPSSIEIGRHIITSSIGIVDLDRFLRALEEVRPHEDSVNVLIRILRLESWLRQLATRGILTNSVFTNRANYSAALGKQERPGSTPKFS